MTHPMQKWSSGTLLLALMSFIGFGPFANGVVADDSSANGSGLIVVVMDPLSLPLSCACVKGVGQRKYESLADRLAMESGKSVRLVYEESLQLAKRRNLPKIDVVIGKRSTVLSDAKAVELPLVAVAGLADQGGSTEIHGVVLVSKASAVRSLQDLAGKKVAIGPPEHDECNLLARRLFATHPVAVEIVECSSIENAVYALSDQEVDAVVVSNFLPPLLEGCGKIAKGSVRKLGTTEPSAGVQVFASEDLSDSVLAALMRSLVATNVDPQMKLDLESSVGFVLTESNCDSEPLALVTEGWFDWRGANRAGQFPNLPRTLSEQPEEIWTAAVTGPAMAGIAATTRYVIVADKSSEFDEDIFRAFDACNGKVLWTLKQSAAGRMDYTNAPRATPVIVNDKVLFQSVFGRLTCANLDTGDVIWQHHLVDDFEGEMPSWGYCLPPLVIGDRVIIAPGGTRASIMALNLQTGKIIWQTEGHGAAYAPFIHGSFGGREQIIGFDTASLGGWDPETGVRLWELVPPDNSDFHVGTPVELNGGVLLATENNGTRLYGFHPDGTIIPSPRAENFDCGPDTCTPVVLASAGQKRIFCSAYGELFCLDADEKLETLWSQTDDRFYDHTNLIAGNDRILLWGTDCDLLLLDGSRDDLEIVSAWRPMGGEKPESMSHPALIGDRLYVRSQTELKCLRLQVPMSDNNVK
jgi:outer membrane protein assembly factor BamB/ABC-type phosphate/phosphonate transport system substrate-binding protein